MFQSISPNDQSYIYTKWLSTNFNYSENTNIFKPEYIDDIDIEHDNDEFNSDYLEPEFTYNTGYDDSMFDEEPVISYNSDNEESYDSYEYVNNTY